MINDKIGKLISELDTATGMLIVLSLKDKIVYEAREKIQNVSIELGDLIQDIEVEKEIDNCRVRILEMSDEGTGDCGMDENGLCYGYSNEDVMHEECRTCEYSVICEED